MNENDILLPKFIVSMTNINKYDPDIVKHYGIQTTDLIEYNMRANFEFTEEDIGGYMEVILNVLFSDNYKIIGNELVICKGGGYYDLFEAHDLTDAIISQDSTTTIDICTLGKSKFDAFMLNCNTKELLRLTAEQHSTPYDIMINQGKSKWLFKL